MRVVADRKIFDAIEIGRLGLFCFALREINVAEKHPCSAGTPEKIFAFRLIESDNGGIHFVLFQIAEGDSKTNPFDFVAVFKTGIGKGIITGDGFRKFARLLQFKRPNPNVVGVLQSKAELGLELRIDFCRLDRHAICAMKTN